MADSMLSILYHIIKAEAVIKEKLGPTPEGSASTSSTSSAAARPPVEPAPQPELNMQHLQQVCARIFGLGDMTVWITVFDGLCLSLIF